MKKFVTGSILSSILLSFAPVSFALTTQLRAEPGTTQFVILINALPQVSSIKPKVEIDHYDGTGKCWNHIMESKFEKDGITYPAFPVVAGAGGGNACGKKNTKEPNAIIKIDIHSTDTIQGTKIYDDLNNVKIDPNKFYNIIIIKEKFRPVFNENGLIKTPGELKVEQVTN